MQIGEVADRTGRSLRTIRHYEEVGLAQLSARSQGGFRLYTDDDVARLLVIKAALLLGFALTAPSVAAAAPSKTVDRRRHHLDSADVPPRAA